MKNNFEMYQSVLSRRDEYLKKKEKRRLIIKRTVPVLACFCFAAAAGLFFRQNYNKLPDIPVVTETVTTSVTETDAPLSAPVTETLVNTISTSPDDTAVTTSPDVTLLTLTSLTSDDSGMDLNKPSVGTTIIPVAESASSENNGFTFQDIEYRKTGRIADPSCLNEITAALPASVDDQPIDLKLFSIGNISTKIAVAVQDKAEGVYYLYTGNYVPQTLQSLFKEYALDTDWDITGITNDNSPVYDYDKNEIYSGLHDLPDIGQSSVSLPGRLLKIEITNDSLGRCSIMLTESGDIICDFTGFELSYHVGEDNINRMKELIL